jgi:uncharacterized protein
MEFDNSFDVPLSPADAWAVLTDIPRITPCMPGAELTEIVDPANFRGRISVRFGPVLMAFAGRVVFDHVDESTYTARVMARGDDVHGRGSADAMATFRILPIADGSRVMIHTDLTLAGTVAQYGRGISMIQATAAQIVGQFAGNLRAQLAPQRRAAAAAVTQPDEALSKPLAVEPVSGLSLTARAGWQQLTALITGRKP